MTMRSFAFGALMCCQYLRSLHGSSSSSLDFFDARLFPLLETFSHLKLLSRLFFEVNIIGLNLYYLT